MLGTFLVWLLYAVFLKVAIGVATDVSPQENSLLRAFLTAGVLSIGQAAVTFLGPVWILWPILWLFVIKSVYSIGWGRAFLVWLALMVMGAALVMLVLVPLGLMAGLSLAVF
ncbi:MAG: hypothetical protein AAF721_28285 [Myxococcota bacterium]